MSTDRDVTRIVRSWLDEGVTQLPDRVLDLVLDQLPATPQRRPSWLARRTPTMNNYARLGLVAAAVVAVVIVGIGLFGKSMNVGPAASPAPSESAAAPDPLAGRWAAPATTCEQQNATVKAAGFTDEQISLSRWSCSAGSVDHYSVRFWTPQTRALMTVLNGTEQASQTNYRIVDDQTVEQFFPDDPFCIALRYSIDGDQLTFDVQHGCASTGDAPLNDQVALTAILETSSFTRQP